MPETRGGLREEMVKDAQSEREKRRSVLGPTLRSADVHPHPSVGTAFHMRFRCRFSFYDLSAMRSVYRYMIKLKAWFQRVVPKSPKL